MAAPTAARSNIGRSRVWQESTFGADPSASIGSFGDLRLVGGVMPVNDPEMLPDTRIVQSIHERFADVVGFRKGDGLSFKGYLCGSGQTLDSAASATQTTVCKMLERVVGGYQGTAGSAYASAAAPTGVTVTGGHGSRFLQGTIAAIESASGSGLFCARKIATRATDAITWSIATGLGSTAFTVASGCRLLGSLMIYPTNTPTNNTALAFVCESEDRYQTYWYSGANASTFGIEWPIGKDLMWSTTMQAARRWKDTEVASGLGTGSAIASATYDDGARVVATAGTIWFTPSGGTTLAAPHIAELSVNLGTKWVPGPSFNGTEGVGYYEYLPDQCSATIVVPYDRTYETARDAGTTYQLMAQAGQTAGGIVAFEMPTAQIVACKVVDKGGLRRHELTLKALRDTTTTSSVTDLGLAPWRLAWM